MAEQSLGTIGNAHSQDQIAHMENTIGKGICPFCRIDTSLNRIIRSGAHWNVWPNPFAYQHTRVHLVFATKEHLTMLDELGPAWPELHEHVVWAEREFDAQGGGVSMRFGSPEYSGATLAHAHAHFLVPDGTGPVFSLFHTMCGDQTDLLAKAFTRR